MKKSLIAIFIVIVLLHLLALVILLRYRSSDGAAPKPPTPDPIPEPQIDSRSALAPQAGSSQQRPSSKPISRTTFPTVKQLPRQTTATKLDFSAAVRGDIKELPDTSKAAAGIIVDLGSGKVLWAKNSSSPLPIASMTKMMTTLIIAEDLDDGKISKDMQINVSKNAAAIGGSGIWLDPRESFPLHELFTAMVIKSANDAAYLLAESLAGGDVSKFVARMNTRATGLGMGKTFFTNPHGLPETSGKDNSSTAEDIVILAEELLRHQTVMQLSATPVTFIDRKVGKTDKTMLANTNMLVRRNIPGVDGLKTGYTRNAGSCVTISCLRDGRRMIVVLIGCEGSKLRDALAAKLLDWAYQREIPPENPRIKNRLSACLKE